MPKQKRKDFSFKSFARRSARKLTTTQLLSMVATRLSPIAEERSSAERAAKLADDALRIVREFFMQKNAFRHSAASGLQAAVRRRLAQKKVKRRIRPISPNRFYGF